MSRRLRNLLTSIFCIYFLIIGSIIALKVNGYNIIFDNGFRLKNSVNIDLDSYPQNADIFLDNTKINKTPKIINLNSGQDFKITVQKAGFLPQEFEFSTPEKQNSFLKLDKNLLLPTNGEEINLKEKYKKMTILQLLDENKILAKDQNEIFYIFNFYQNTKELDSPFILQNSAKNGGKITNWQNFRKIGEGQFINENWIIFWDNEEQNWNFKEIKKHQQAVKFDDDNFLFLDESGNIWRQNLKEENAILMDTNVKKMSFNHDQIWILKGTKIFNINKNNHEFLELEEVLDFLTPQICQDFKIENVGFNLAIKCDENLYYKTEKFLIFLGKANVFQFQDHKIFWQDLENNLFEYNTRNFKKNLLPFFDVEKLTNIYFHKQYDTLFLHVNNEILAGKYYDFWQNSILKKVHSQPWQKDKKCIFKDNSRAISCLGEKVKIYQNSDLLF